MKKYFIIALAAVGLLATLNSCSKEEQADLKPVKTAEGHPLDPTNSGHIELGNGELYYYKDSVTTYGQASPNYLLLKPLSLDKYKNGELLDSVCNKDLAIRFESKGRLIRDKTTLWGSKPIVTDEHAPVITINTDYSFTIKFSKMLTAFGYEFNSLYTKSQVNIHNQFRNSKLNKHIPPAITTPIDEDTYDVKWTGAVGGARIRAIESQTPFDEVTISFKATQYGAPPLPGTFDLLLSGFRYKLAK